MIQILKLNKSRERKNRSQIFRQDGISPLDKPISLTYERLLTINILSNSNYLNLPILNKMEETKVYK